MYAKQILNQNIYQIKRKTNTTKSVTSTDLGHILPRDLDQRLRRQQAKSTLRGPEFEKRPRSQRNDIIQNQHFCVKQTINEPDVSNDTLK